MGNQPVPHLVENTFLLYVLNGLLSCTAVLMQPLWSPLGSVTKPKERVPASVRAAARGQGNTKAPATTTLEMEAPVSIGLVPLPLQLADGDRGNGASVQCKGALAAASASILFPDCFLYTGFCYHRCWYRCRCYHFWCGSSCAGWSGGVERRAGLWHGTEEEASITVPAKLPSALAALGLEKAVGYLWMVPKDVCALPSAASGVYVPGDEKRDTVYVPYTISIGVPLYNSGLCTMVRTMLLGTVGHGIAFSY